MKETILVTGAQGMIGSRLVQGLLDAGYSVLGIDKVPAAACGGCFYHNCDLGDKAQLRELLYRYPVTRIIHLAALAHTKGADDLSWERYYRINVECAKNIFELAGERPVLFISTVDVYGFFNGGVADDKTELRPVTPYGKSKKLAEEECRKLPHFSIFRLSPVYTEEIKRDIQKRYYLKYPQLAYQIGRGSEYEILNINKAIQAMVEWCAQEPQNETRIIKDDVPMWTPDYLRAEREAGRAKLILKLPRWLVRCGYGLLKALCGENKYTYLLNKAVHPLKTEC